MPTEIRYVTVEPKRKTNHILHLLLSVITCGLWLPIWLMVSGTTNIRNSQPSHVKNFVILAALIAFAVYYGGRP